MGLHFARIIFRYFPNCIKYDSYTVNYQSSDSFNERRKQIAITMTSKNIVMFDVTPIQVDIDKCNEKPPAYIAVDNLLIESPKSHTFLIYRLTIITPFQRLYSKINYLMNVQ